jgi:adenine-specific DNA-methyltransferase
MGGQGETRESRPNLYYPLVAPDGQEVYPIRQNGADGAWRWSREKVSEESERIEWVAGRAGWVPYLRIYADQMRARPPETVWSFDQVGSNRTSKAEIKKLFPDSESFSTPKPEKLIKPIIEQATQPGDLVLV